VAVSWGVEGESWWLKVKDTGPGLRAGPAAPILTGLKEATIAAREAEEKTAVKEGKRPSVLDQAAAGTGVVPGSGRQQAGEGIGLSIVKRLCELLDASIEMTSSAESGTTFRVVFPRDYRGGDRPS
jgi:two-component sensor histidine kinase